MTKLLVSQTEARRLHGQYGKCTKKLDQHYMLLSSSPSQKVVEGVGLMPQIERFIARMYDKESECSNVNGVRKDLFTRSGQHTKQDISGDNL